jgi:hypothetical protein
MSQQGLTNAIREAQKAHDRPSLIKVTTIIGIGKVSRLLTLAGTTALCCACSNVHIYFRLEEAGY